MNLGCAGDRQDDPRDDPEQFLRVDRRPLIGFDLGEQVAAQRIADTIAALITPAICREPDQ